MKCLICNAEMMKLEKGKPMASNVAENGANVESIVYDIDYSKSQNLMGKLMGSNNNKVYITPEMYVCPTCGYVMQTIAKDDLDLMKVLEEK